MRVLIIGAGYVGMPLALELSRKGHQVFALKRSPACSEEARREGLIPLIADITRPDKLSCLTQPFDWVVNCASSSGGTAADYQSVYLEGNRNVIARLSACPPAKFVLT